MSENAHSAQPAPFEQFAEVFRRARRERNLSQEAAGDVLGVTQVTICRWEAGNSNVQRRLRPAVASFMRISVDQLNARLAASSSTDSVIQFPNRTPDPLAADEIERSAVAMRLLALAEASSDSQPELLIRIARELRLGETH
jgi:transcriptional regulator with XRE-family HTH domain